MPATGQNVEMVAGDSRTLRILVTESDLLTRADLTGCTARWWLARSARSTGANIFLQKTSPSGGVQVDNDGLVTITLDPEDTEDLAPGAYYHECELIDSSSDVATITSGAFTIRPALITPPV